MFLGRIPRHIPALDNKLQTELPRQTCHKLLVGFGLLPAQPVIELNDGNDNAEFTAKVEQQSEQRHGIDPAGNSDTDPVAGVKQFFTADVSQNILQSRIHRNMVSQAWTDALAIHSSNNLQPGTLLPNQLPNLLHKIRSAHVLSLLSATGADVHIPRFRFFISDDE